MDRKVSSRRVQLAAAGMALLAAAGCATVESEAGANSRDSKGSESEIDIAHSTSVYLPEYRRDARLDGDTALREQSAVEAFEIWRAVTVERIAEGAPSQDEALQELARSYGVDVPAMEALLEEAAGTLESAGIRPPEVTDLLDLSGTPIFTEEVRLCGSRSAVSVFAVLDSRPGLLRDSSEEHRQVDLKAAGVAGGQAWISSSPGKGFETVSWISDAYPDVSLSVTTDSGCSPEETASSVSLREVQR